MNKKNKKKKKNIILWELDRSLQICVFCYSLFDRKTHSYLAPLERLTFCSKCFVEKSNERKGYWNSNYLDFSDARNNFMERSV